MYTYQSKHRAYLFANVGFERRTLGQPPLCSSLQDYPHHLATRKRTFHKERGPTLPTPLFMNSADKTHYVTCESRELHVPHGPAPHCFEAS